MDSVYVENLPIFEREFHIYTLIDKLKKEADANEGK